ncbi:hypothetical protein GYMLUDRAFT_61816 [Collybiopsis luxurians FD-317 M1]|uniref:Anaphase-promoting complex subunit 4 WD40 domain-containing protein n=1 Tax=Collybiopsis luxurians FD-317 M1 TaxID=944289 RepID=A0A0D0B119_9AGAR|nr:hypothetical protein GYMLUDRAFT_61816 [Collybiopsis luxurians FD-317 M1]
MPSRWQETDRIVVPDSCSTRNPIVAVAISHDAQYLAVCYGHKADVWNIKYGISASPHSTFIDKSNTHEITSVAWSPTATRLALGHRGGIVHVVTFDGKKFTSQGFHHSDSLSAAVSVVFLHTDILAVAMGRIVKLYKFSGDLNGSYWKLVGSLPDPPFVQGMNSPNVKSVYALSRGRILVAYINGHVAKSSWKLACFPQMESFVPTYELQINVFGVIILTRRPQSNDVWAETDSLLVTDFESNTYKIYHFGSQDVASTLIPRSHGTSQPVSCAKFLAQDVIVGAGVAKPRILRPEFPGD